MRVRGGCVVRTVTPLLETDTFPDIGHDGRLSRTDVAAEGVRLSPFLPEYI